MSAFAAGQGLSEHTAPSDALTVVLEGTLMVSVKDSPIRASQGTVVRLPVSSSPPVDSSKRPKLLLLTLRGRDSGRERPLRCGLTKRGAGARGAPLELAPV